MRKRWRRMTRSLSEWCSETCDHVFAKGCRVDHVQPRAQPGELIWNYQSPWVTPMRRKKQKEKEEEEERMFRYYAFNESPV
jgi:hypothetical protein